LGLLRAFRRSPRAGAECWPREALHACGARQRHVAAPAPAWLSGTAPEAGGSCRGGLPLPRTALPPASWLQRERCSRSNLATATFQPASVDALLPAVERCHRQPSQRASVMPISDPSALAHKRPLITPRNARPLFWIRAGPQGRPGHWSGCLLQQPSAASLCSPGGRSLQDA